MEQPAVRGVDLAAKFGVSRPTVTETVKRLECDGFLTSDRNAGIRLTLEGQRYTEALLRRHRLAERMLFDLLGMDFITAHEQAHALEHWISPDVEEHISNRLGRPATCPHGNPIPGNAPGGVDFLRQQNAHRLADSTVGSGVIVVAISEVVEDESAVLASLMHTGIIPGRRLMIRDVGPLTGQLRYWSQDGEQTIPMNLAAKIWVTPDAPSSDDSVR